MVRTRWLPPKSTRQQVPTPSAKGEGQFSKRLAPVPLAAPTTKRWTAQAHFVQGCLKLRLIPPHGAPHRAAAAAGATCPLSARSTQRFRPSEFGVRVWQLLAVRRVHPHSPTTCRIQAMHECRAGLRWGLRAACPLLAPHAVLLAGARRDAGCCLRSPAGLRRTSGPMKRMSGRSGASGRPHPHPHGPMRRSRRRPRAAVNGAPCPH